MPRAQDALERPQSAGMQRRRNWISYFWTGPKDQAPRHQAEREEVAEQRGRSRPLADSARLPQAVQTSKAVRFLDFEGALV